MKNPACILSSWGNYQKIKSQLHSITDKNIPVSLKGNDYIVYANGRSYGDCALNTNTVLTNKLNSILSFDKNKGVIHCQSGVLLADIIQEVIPQKWFFPVTPGTKYITIGGAVAADVHGKNHHKSGCFSEFIIELKIVMPDGKIVVCNKDENESLFRATCGGMGLTGVIIEVIFQLKAISSTSIEQKTVATKNLENTFKAFEKYKKNTYLVAWIDGLATGKHVGKGLIYIGDDANDNEFDISSKKRIKIPKWFPSFLLNPLSIQIYNWYYYNIHKNTTGKVTIDDFFYPLDGLANWNRIYGKKGFVQYQIVIPKKLSYEGISKILKTVNNSKHTSYLTILKLMGKENENYLSFPLEGYTIAMDFKVKKGLWSFLNHLDSVILEYNGRAYLAKDGRMTKGVFEKGYLELEAFKMIRKQYSLEKLQSLQSKRLGL